ncbi:hypothetical protein HD806DRAFT_75917 [Xylariaceae sp. AK1471]|nr:hypothetical protein HD806DRAFT_75917 [Xylariaceae sp. AK1471]
MAVFPLSLGSFLKPAIVVGRQPCRVESTVESTGIDTYLAHRHRILLLLETNIRQCYKSFALLQLLRLAYSWTRIYPSFDPCLSRLTYCKVGWISYVSLCSKRFENQSLIHTHILLSYPLVRPALSSTCARQGFRGPLSESFSVQVTEVCSASVQRCLGRVDCQPLKVA